MRKHREQTIVPLFNDEIAEDRQSPLSQPPGLELERENLEKKIEKLEDGLESLVKIQARSSESNLHNKVNEIQEELSMKRFDLYVANIHLAAIRSQLSLFMRQENRHLLLMQSQSQLAGAIGQSGQHSNGRNLVGQYNDYFTGVDSRKLSSSSAASSYKNKWIKAFKSLKDAPSNSGNSKSGGANSQQRQVPNDLCCELRITRRKLNVAASLIFSNIFTFSRNSSFDFYIFRVYKSHRCMSHLVMG